MEPLPRFFPLNRTIGFSDAVFAVAITVLVLGIDVPSDDALSPAALALQREAFFHQLLVYVVSFWLIAMYWSQHSLLFAALRRMDRGLAVLNLLFLLPLTLLPFVTQLMGARRNDWRVVLVFAVTNLFAVFFFERLWKHVSARPEIHKDPHTQALARRLMWRARFFGAVLISGVLLSLLNVRAGILLILLIPTVYFINSIRDPLRIPGEPASADDAD
jgi:uncharacterized membrane protein